MPSTTDIRDDLGYLLWQLQARLKQRLEARLAHTHLSLAQFSALAVVRAHPGLSAAELARELPITPQAVSNLVVRMEAVGYLTRSAPTTGRNQPLELTPAGVQTLEEAAALVAAEEQAFFEVLPSDQRTQLHALADVLLSTVE